MAMSPTVVCNNILQRAFQENVSVSPMKLQKLMYFTACEYAKQTDADMLTEDFSVWQYGPVLPTVYSEFKAFGSGPITGYAKDATGVSYAINEEIAPKLKSCIDRIWCRFKEFGGIALSQITHKEGSGWSIAFSKGNDKITTEDMKADNSYGEYMYP